MPFNIILHIPNEAAVLCELEELPKPADNIIIVSNPRQRDGKDLHYIDSQTAKVIWPLVKIGFIEVLGDSEEDKIVGFVRE